MLAPNLLFVTICSNFCPHDCPGFQHIAFPKTNLCATGRAKRCRSYFPYTLIFSLITRTREKCHHSDTSALVLYSRAQSGKTRKITHAGLSSPARHFPGKSKTLPTGHLSVWEEAVFSFFLINWGLCQGARRGFEPCARWTDASFYDLRCVESAGFQRFSKDRHRL